MRRKLLTLFLILILTLGFGCALAQNTSDDTAVITTIDNVRNLFTVDGVLYAFSWNGLFRFDEANQNPIPVQSNVDMMDITQLTAYGDTLFALDYEETLSSITFGENGLGEQTVIASLPIQKGDDIYSNCQGFVADADAVWVLIAVSDMDRPFEEATLYRVDRASGEVTLVEVDSLTNLCAYKDGLLLARQLSRQNHENDDYLPKLISIDKSSLSATTLCTLSDINLSAPAYDAANDLIYLASSTALIRLDSAFQPEKCALLSLPYISDGTSSLLHNNRYIIATRDEPLGFAACETDPSSMPAQTLKIGHFYMDDTTRNFSKEHPEIAVELTEKFFSASSIAKQMLSASSEIDVYSIQLGSDSIAPVRDKGYYADLSESSILTNTVSRMYPQFSAHCYTSEGKLFALPYDVRIAGVGHSPSSLKKLGLTEEDLPSTHLELLDFLVDWVETNGDDGGDLPLFEMVYDIRQQLYQLIETDYIGSYLRRNEQLTFDTPLFRSLLKRLDEATPVLECLNQPEANLAGFTVTYDSDGAPSLFTLNDELTPSQFSPGDYVPLMLSLDENTPPVFQCTQQVLLLNPYSENKDNALLYLEYVAEHLDPYQSVAMFPDNNEPIARESFQKQIDNFSATVDDLQKRLEAADDTNKKSLEANLKNMQDKLELLKQDEQRWALSAQEIATYRKLLPLAVLNTENFLPSNILSLSGRYLENQLSADEFISEAERLLRMVRLEDE